MKLLRSTYTGLLLVAFVGCKQEGTEEVKWQECSTPGGYVFDMPGDPEPRSETHDGVPTFSLRVKCKDREYYIWHLSVAEFDAIDYAKGIGNLANQLKGSITSVTDHGFNELTGKAFEIDANDKSVRIIGRAFRPRKWSIYAIAVAGKDVRVTDADVQRFFGSIRKVATPNLPGINRPAAPASPSAPITPPQKTNLEIALDDFALRFLTQLNQGQFSRAYEMLSQEMKQKESLEEFTIRIKQWDALLRGKKSTRVISQIVFGDPAKGIVTAICEGEEMAGVTVVFALERIHNKPMAIMSLEIKEVRRS